MNKQNRDSKCCCATKESQGWNETEDSRYAGNSMRVNRAQIVHVSVGSWLAVGVVLLCPVDRCSPLKSVVLEETIYCMAT